MAIYEKNEEELMNKFTEFLRVCRKNRVFPECEFLELFKQNIGKMEIIIPKKRIMYRSRVYQDDMLKQFEKISAMVRESKTPDDYQLASDETERLRQEYINKINDGFEGYDEKNSFVNEDVENVIASRCNHNFETCLYTSDDAQTSISEIKPIIGETISVAPIEALEDLKIIDLSIDFNEEWDELVFLRNLIALLFIDSPTEGHKEAYIYTQIICSLVKKMGYDGVKYSSCQNIEKINYAIFNYKKCKATGSEKYSITKIDYGIEKMKAKKER